MQTLHIKPESYVVFNLTYNEHAPPQGHTPTVPWIYISSD